jgi:predicted metal-dependent hydrolase
VPLAFVRNPKARRYILRFYEGVARVTIPRGGSLHLAYEFARKNGAWIEKQLHRVPSSWDNGTDILFRGDRKTLNFDGLHASFADQEVTVEPGDDLRIVVESRMRTLATKELTERAWLLARELGLEVSVISVRNQRSRLGSCSLKKRISLNWRLIQTPEFVRDYIIVHELMHLREMNHSQKFWAHVENAFPQWREGENWLRRNSALLR